jgi:hypothetical protein
MGVATRYNPDSKSCISNRSSKRVKATNMPFLIEKSEKSSFYEKIVKLILLKRKLPSITERKTPCPLPFEPQ